MGLAVVSLVLAALLGFAIHRGSVCVVRGVAEVLSTGRAYMLLSFVKAVLWVMIVTTPVLWLVPSPHPVSHAWAMSESALIGGFLFGIGAAINRGCAFSTLGRLGNGELGTWLTLGGFALGVWSFVSAVTWWGLPSRQPLPRSDNLLDPVTGGLVAGLALWGLWELVRLWRTRPPGSLRELLLAGSYRLSAAAALIGIANGILYALHGPWTYTRTFHDAVASRGADLLPLILPLGLFSAVVAGAVISAWQRGTFRLDWRPSRIWLQDFAGGLLMGLGAALTPGGNDVLVLHNLPQLSPHALPAFLAMGAGIAMVLGIMRAARGVWLEVDCSEDLCRTRWVAPARRARTGTDPAAPGAP